MSTTRRGTFLLAVAAALAAGPAPAQVTMGTIVGTVKTPRARWSRAPPSS